MENEFGNTIKAVLTKDPDLELTLHPKIINETLGFSTNLLPYAEYLNKYTFLDENIYYKLALLLIPKQSNRFIGWIKADKEIDDNYGLLAEDVGRYFKIGGNDLRQVLSIIRLKAQKDMEFLRKLLEDVGFDYTKYRLFGLKYDYGEKKKEVKTQPVIGLGNWM